MFSHENLIIEEKIHKIIYIIKEKPPHVQKVLIIYLIYEIVYKNLTHKINKELIKNFRQQQTLW